MSNQYYDGSVKVCFMYGIFIPLLKTDEYKDVERFLATAAPELLDNGKLYKNGLTALRAGYTLRNTANYTIKEYKCLNARYVMVQLKVEIVEQKHYKYIGHTFVEPSRAEINKFDEYTSKCGIDILAYRIQFGYLF